MHSEEVCTARRRESKELLLPGNLANKKICETIADEAVTDLGGILCSAELHNRRS
jgi:hypothetical protein